MTYLMRAPSRQQTSQANRPGLQMDASVPCRNESPTTTTCHFLVAIVLILPPLGMHALASPATAVYTSSSNSRTSDLFSCWTATGPEEVCCLLPEVTEAFFQASVSTVSWLVSLSIFHDCEILFVYWVNEDLMLTNVSEPRRLPLQLSNLTPERIYQEAPLTPPALKLPCLLACSLVLVLLALVLVDCGQPSLSARQTLLSC